MTPQQIASTILDEFTASPNPYPHLDMDGNISGSVVALSTSTGVTITVSIFATSVATARVQMERGASIVSSAIFTESSQEGLVDTTVGYIARILHQLNHQATV